MTSSSSVGVNSSNNNNSSVLQHHHQQDASASFQQQQPVAGTTGFRSPNVVAPGSQPIPFLQHRATAVTGAATGGVQAHPSGSNNAFVAPPVVRAQPVYPFASMTHAAQSVLGQTATSSPSSSTSSPSPNQAAAAIRLRPAVSTIMNHAAVGVPVASTATATPPPPLSPALSPSSAFACATPSQLLPSALHPAAVKSAPVVDGAPSNALTPMQQQSVGGSRSPHFQQTAAPGSTLTVAGGGGLSTALTTVSPSPHIGPIRPSQPSINMQQTVPVTTAASSPLLVNLLQQQQQQQLARNSLSSNSSSSNSPTTAVAVTAAGQPINQVPCVGVVNSSTPIGVTTSPVTVAMDNISASENMEKVRQQGSSVGSRVAGGRSLSLSSPLSSSPSASPYHHTSSPNSPATTETNLTLAASVTVLNVRTGAPLNATALSSLAPPPALSSAHTAAQNPTTASSVVPESGETLQVCPALYSNSIKL